MDHAVKELVQRAGDEVEFLVLSGELAEELRPLVEWHPLRFPRRPFPLRYIAFQAIGGVRLRHLKVDLIHTLGAIVPNRVDVASVHACHSGLVRGTGMLAPPGAPTLRRLNTGLSRILSLAAERWTYRAERVRVLAAVSRGVAAELEREYPGVRVEITPNGVDVDRFRPDSEARAALRRTERLDDDEYVVLFVGGNWDHKGLALAIEAIARLDSSAVPVARLWIVGAGRKERFQEVARRHGVTDRVTFFGPRADVERFYQAADAFVLPSFYEAFSLVLLEAAASGLPTVTTAVSGVDELGGTADGVLIVERTPGSVASALARLATDRELRARLGELGRRRATEYTWERSVESVLCLYRQLLVDRVALTA
jgi:UDP-glucose:(heptosyl)LPS alpha-1,3-glucosyltransferase